MLARLNLLLAWLSVILCFLFISLTFRALSVIFYLLFLFTVVLVLVNVLIAQMSDTYSKVLSTAEGVYLYHRCQFIARLESQRLKLLEDRNWCLTVVHGIVTLAFGLPSIVFEQFCLRLLWLNIVS